MVLLDKALSLLDKTKEERIQYLREDKWIGYPRAIEVLDVLDDLITYPKVERMPNLLIVGDSNNGKTQVIRKFEKRYPLTIDEETGLNIQPVVLVSAPSKPDEGEFISRLLEYLFVPYTKNDSLAIRKSQVIRTLRTRQTRMLIIDEIQHIIAGSYNSQRAFLNTLKDFSNELKIPIVGAGVEDAFHAIQVDPQLANRFQIEVLERWQFNTSKQKELFAQLIASIEQRLPLSEPSFLYKPPLIKKLHYLSEGLIGEVFDLIKKLAVLAIRKELNCITVDLLDEGNFLPPSRRKERLKKIR